MFCLIKYGFFCQMWMFAAFPWRPTHVSVLLDWLGFDWLLVPSHVCCLTDPGLSLPSAGGTKSHTDFTISILAKLFLICWHPDRLFSYYLCFTSLQSVSFTQISPLAMRSDTSVHPTFLLTPLTVLYMKVLKRKVSVTKVWLLKDSRAQPIKFYHNLLSICIEKKSLSLAVDIRAAYHSQRIEEISEKMQTCLP